MQDDRSNPHQPYLITINHTIIQTPQVIKHHTARIAHTGPHPPPACIIYDNSQDQMLFIVIVEFIICYLLSILFVICYLLFIMYYLLCIICHVLFVIYCLLFILDGIPLRIRSHRSAAEPHYEQCA